MKKKLFFLFLATLTLCKAQDGAQANPFFKKEVTTIQEKYNVLDGASPTIVFTGSSSIRLWKDLEERFPDHNILNTGFGGSQTSDLLGYVNELVLQYKPTKVFIYEGDNDISTKKRKREILGDMNKIITAIKAKLPNTEIILISPKPSISRWHWRGRYKRLNRKLAALAQETDNLSFVDVWYPMLNGRKLRKELFIEDGLHMNNLGYDIWYQAIKGYMD